MMLIVWLHNTVLDIRELGTSAWSSKTMANSGLCQFGLNTTVR